MARPPRTVRWLKVVAALALALYLHHALTAGASTIVYGDLPDDDVKVEAAPTLSHAERMAADKSQCWGSHDEPLVELPGHAVVTLTKTGETVYTANHDDVGEAFGEALALAGFGDEISQRLDTVALCR